MSGFFSRFGKLTVAERLAPFGLRPDTLAAAQAMVSDPRTDVEIAALESVLTHAETVLRMMDGRYDGDRGLLVLTDHRVFFRTRGRNRHIPFSVQLVDVVAIEGSTHKAVGSVRVISADGSVVVGDILGNQGEQLASQARDAMAGRPRPARDPLAALVELRALRDNGTITAAEFEVRKAGLWREI